MTPGNWYVLAIWLALMASFVAGVVLWDVWLAKNRPGRTISWSMALLGRAQPLFVFWIGFACCWVITNLAAHFWPTMTGVVDWDTITQQQATIDQLRAKLDALTPRPGGR